MRILLTGNCQVDGLEVFLKRAIPRFEFHRLPHLATFYSEFTEEQIAAEHEWADIVFFHHKHDGAQNYPTKHPKIPLSVWHQAGPFFTKTEDSDWAQVYEHQRVYGEHSAIEFAVKEADMGYVERWTSNYARMKEKEWDEGVPEKIRISDLMLRGVYEQQQLTCNHPTSLVFKEWSERICEFLGEPIGPNAVSEAEARSNPNIGGLPCEESATSGAVKWLSLKWGGRPEDDESGRQIARERLAKIV